MLSDDEKEAIEQLKSWREYIIKHKEKVNKANDIEFYLRTALNLITKLQKENREKNKYIKHSEEITAEMNNDINKLLLEIKEKDKQIDLMLDKIDMTKPSPCTMTNEYNIGRVCMSKNEKRKYFEKKAKEEGE